MMPLNGDAPDQEAQGLVFGELIRPLTRQELHVLDFLRQGYTNEDIARALNIAVSTVSSHVQHILKKLQVRNRVEAVLYMRHQDSQSDAPHASPAPATTQESTGRSEIRPASLRSRDPLLFFCQVNQVNRYIALYGPLSIDYADLPAMISLVFYDAHVQHLKMHLAWKVHPGEMNVEVDETLWKHILEATEGDAKALFSSTPAASNGQR